MHAHTHIHTHTQIHTHTNTHIHTHTYTHTHTQLVYLRACLAVSPANLAPVRIVKSLPGKKI